MGFLSMFIAAKSLKPPSKQNSCARSRHGPFVQEAEGDALVQVSQFDAAAYCVAAEIDLLEDLGIGREAHRGTLLQVLLNFSRVQPGGRAGLCRSWGRNGLETDLVAAEIGRRPPSSRRRGR